MTDEASTLAGGIPDKRAVDTRSNFGSWGWSIVAIEGFMLWVSAGVQVHGLNIMVPTLSEHFGIARTTLLFWATPASWGSVIAGFVCAVMAEKWGAKATIIVSLVMCALCFGMLGTWGTVPGFVILFFGVCFFGSGYAYVGGFALIANWFPRKKNLAFGWVTMGQTFSTAVFVPLLAFLFAHIGVQAGFWAISVIMVLQLVIVLLVVKNMPEERGVAPDNMPMTAEELEASKAAAEAAVSPFTTLQLLKMRDVWFIALGSGGIFVMLVGVLAQLVPRLMDLGYPVEQAILYLSIAALIGVPGAYLWGWVGQKFGTKAGLMLYTAWWLVAVILNMFELSPVILYSLARHAGPELRRGEQPDHGNRGGEVPAGRLRQGLRPDPADPGHHPVLLVRHPGVRPHLPRRLYRRLCVPRRRRRRRPVPVLAHGSDPGRMTCRGPACSGPLKQELRAARPQTTRLLPAGPSARPFAFERMDARAGRSIRLGAEARPFAAGGICRIGGGSAATGRILRAGSPVAAVPLQWSA